jgi:hypothetical protein
MLVAVHADDGGAARSPVGHRPVLAGAEGSGIPCLGVGQPPDRSGSLSPQAEGPGESRKMGYGTHGSGASGRSPSKT